MEIVQNKYLHVKTRNPITITDAIPESEVIGDNAGIFTVAVKWGLWESQMLRHVKIKGVPSPILRDYSWPGMYRPMAHQRTTSEFLTLHRRAFCFNEQGTGKTASAIWASDYLLTAGYIKRVLVICPLSIMQAAWQRDLFQFAIHRSVGLAHGTREKRRRVVADSYEYVVINYDGIEIILPELLAGGFDLVIVDEANAYKTPTTKRWKALSKLAGDNTWMWLMTGTPAAHSPVDAYGLAKLAVPHRVPKYAGSFKDSVMFAVGRFRWVPKSDATDTVFKALQPAIRYAKKDCLDLPEVTYVNRDAPLTAQQQKYYDILRKEFLMTAGDEKVTSANVAVNLNKLLQVACGAIYTNSKAVLEFDAHIRLAVMAEVIEESSNKVLVFVPFTHTIELIEKYLRSKNIPCEIISGNVSVTKRSEIINRFQTKDNSDIKVLVIQPMAAAHGVTLTAADTIIWYAPPISIEIYLQANARIDRQGQKNTMTIFHLAGSRVEHVMYQKLQTKLGQHFDLIELYNEEIGAVTA